MIKKTDQTKKGVELMIPGIVIGVIVLVIVIWLISSYNGFVTLRNKTEEASKLCRNRQRLCETRIRDIRESRSRKKSGDDSDKYR